MQLSKEQVAEIQKQLQDKTPEEIVDLIAQETAPSGILFGGMLDVMYQRMCHSRIKANLMTNILKSKICPVTVVV